MSNNTSECDSCQNEKIETEYKSAVDYLFSRLPMFSRVGGAAYKPGLERVEALSEFFGHPHRKFKSIHIAGTNGKGSTSHSLAAILQTHGLKTGLYTSPHLTDFRERIRINGKMIPKKEVIDFVKLWKETGYNGEPSFFELIMIMAFDWFAKENVDIAVIETGMGGRLDSTNIISPELCIITNISFDHTQFLGSTLPQIAAEKAGIIKQGIPVVIGEADKDIEIVFEKKAAEMQAPLIKAYENPLLMRCENAPSYGLRCFSTIAGEIHFPLGGDYQKKNLNTILHSVQALNKVGFNLQPDEIAEGLRNVDKLTGIRGRWTIISEAPLTICDTGHNLDGIKSNVTQLKRLQLQHSTRSSRSQLHIVLGFVADKDVEHILQLFPTDAIYYVTNAAIPRAMQADKLTALCIKAGLQVGTYSDPLSAYTAALAAAGSHDIIFIGGSTFIVADFLAAYKH